MRLLVPQCLQEGFLHAAAMEIVAVPFSSPCLAPKVQRGAPSTALQVPLRSAPIYLFPCDQEELQVDPGSDPVSASHQGASCSIPIAVPYCFYKLVILSPSGAVVSKEAKSRRTGI